MGWLNAKTEKEFGVSLARVYLEKNPSKGTKRERKFSAVRQPELLARMTLQLVKVKSEIKLNI